MILYCDFFSSTFLSCNVFICYYVFVILFCFLSLLFLYLILLFLFIFFFFFNDTATTDIYTYGHTLSLPVALPIEGECGGFSVGVSGGYGTYLSAPNGANEPEAWNAGLVVGFGGFQLGGSYADSSDTNNGTDGEAYNVGVSYTTGPLGVSLNYFNGEVEGNLGSGGTVAQTEQDTFHLAANYTLGPGVVASATLGHAVFESDDVAGEQEATYLVTGIKLSF